MLTTNSILNIAILIMATLKMAYLNVAHRIITKLKTRLANGFVLLLLVATSTSVYALPQQLLVPGGLAMLKISNYTNDTRVMFENKRVAVFKHGDDWVAMAGISLKQPVGEAAFSIQYPNGVSLKTKVDIEHKSYKEQRLKIKNKRKVNPLERDLTRINKEFKRKHAAKTHWSDTLPHVDFAWPTEGIISSIFGLRRFFNDQERRPHTGLDIAAPEGTPVTATAAGTVIESGDFFFSGNVIYIDHGQGIISLYAHLHTIDVKIGDVVKQGQQIGTVGETGRVTGPHLHFAVVANETLVDPELLLPAKTSPKPGKAKTAN